MEHIFETVEADTCLGVVVDGTMTIMGVTAQREEIVRCRDCDAYRQLDGFCDMLQRRVMPDGFCAWGERDEKPC